MGRGRTKGMVKLTGYTLILEYALISPSEKINTSERETVIIIDCKLKFSVFFKEERIKGAQRMITAGFEPATLVFGAPGVFSTLGWRL
jgi:hypothetical protein